MAPLDGSCTTVNKPASEDFGGDTEAGRVPRISSDKDSYSEGTEDTGCRSALDNVLTLNRLTHAECTQAPRPGTVRLYTALPSEHPTRSSADWSSRVRHTTQVRIGSVITSPSYGPTSKWVVDPAT
jgi:hypothetical protein